MSASRAAPHRSRGAAPPPPPLLHLAARSAADVRVGMHACPAFVRAQLL